MFFDKKILSLIMASTLACVWMLSGCSLAVPILDTARNVGHDVESFLSDYKSENIRLAEECIDIGDFDRALEYYIKARAETKDTAAIDASIQMLDDFQTAQDYVDNGQYTEAIAALQQLRNRVTDSSSPLYAAIEDLLAQAQSAQSDSEFADDFQRAQEYLQNQQFDQCAAMLDTLDADDTLTSGQKKQVSDLRKRLKTAQIESLRQGVNEQQLSTRGRMFLSQMDKLEESDLQIASAATPEDELALTAASFEQWDALLVEMYDYLSTILNADQYAAEEASFQQWVEERNTAAVDAANSTSDNISNQIASYSLRQSYTKIRCYQLLDMM